MVYLFIVIGLVQIGAAIPLLLRRVPPNHLYGLRVSETLGNAGIWYEANARSARDLLWVGVGTVVAAVALYLLPWGHPDHYALVVCGLLVAGVIWYCVRGVRIARAVHREIVGRPRP